jgi:predicted RNA binding protein YcfA (HicA-like mRNA interferase family)
MSVSEIKGMQIVRVLESLGYQKTNKKPSHHLFTCEGRESITVKFTPPNGKVSRCAMRNLSKILGISIHQLYEVATSKKHLKEFLENL